MEKVFVLNSSPIISLSKAGLNFILEKLIIKIPQDVAIELSHEKYVDEAREFIITNQNKIISDYVISDKIRDWGLGNGESSVLSVVLKQKDWIAVIDDGEARKCAKVYNLNLTGTIGLILIDYKIGLIDSLEQAFYSIKNAGLYLNENLISDLLKKFDRL